MNKKDTYLPNDIEQLLLDKSYDELSNSEKQFADNQIESSAEYNEMRATLISIKQLAQEKTSVAISPKVKEDLMQLMEEKANRVPWYTWNGIAAILFPANTPLFRKPGLQFAVMGLLLLLVVNIGINEFGNKNNQLAVISKKEIKNTKKNIKNEEKTQKNTVIKNNESIIEYKRNEEEITRGSGKQEAEIEIDKKDVKELLASPVLKIVDMEIDEKVDFDSEDIEEVAEPVTLKDRLNANESNQLQPISVANNARAESVNSFPLNEISMPEPENKLTKKKVGTSTSQSLIGHDAVIDLLFVTL